MPPTALKSVNVVFTLTVWFTGAVSVTGRITVGAVPVPENPGSDGLTIRALPASSQGSCGGGPGSDSRASSTRSVQQLLLSAIGLLAMTCRTYFFVRMSAAWIIAVPLEESWLMLRGTACKESGPIPPDTWYKAI